MEDKLKQEVAQIIERILAGKDDDEKMARTETALEESASKIESLTSELEAATAKNDELTSKVVEFEAAEEELDKTKTEEADAAKAAAEETVKKIEDLEAQLAEKTEELDDIQKNTVAAGRMAELETAGVAREDKEAQTTKVREMSDEEFASYKDELESVRKHILAELKSKSPAEGEEAEAKAKEEAEAKAKEEADAKAAAGGDGEGVDVAPAQIDASKVVQAAMNVEIYPSEDMTKQYADLGKALAEAITKDK